VHLLLVPVVEVASDRLGTSALEEIMTRMTTIILQYELK
jgi:hypothetical protein